MLGESVASRLAGRSPAIAAPIAMSVVVVFTLLLMRGTKLGDSQQRVTSLVKALALLALVVACFVFGGSAHDAARAARRPAGAAAVRASRRSCSPRSR